MIDNYLLLLFPAPITVLMGALVIPVDWLLPAAAWQQGATLGGCVTASLLVLFARDQQITDWVQRRRYRTADRIARLFKRLGEWLNWLPLLLATFWLGGHFGNAHLQATVMLCGSSVLVAGLMAHGVQVLLHRHRPCTGSLPTRWGGLRHSTGHKSFPSGHAAVAFALFTMVALQFAHIPIVPPLAISLAALAALSRVYDHAHWPSDVFAGSGLGVAVAFALTHIAH
jgi:membrane-associated phospholipid phosphatase